jgi:iron-sulfur cluster repair protein YtfE (RIC family)
MSHATTTAAEHRPQLTLPGQSHTAEGPHDQTGMYVMHHGFRRDLTSFRAAVENTPVSATETWAALEARWLRFADVLHHHHQAEDDHLWPLLISYAERAGDQEDLELLADMEAEHAVIDPALQAAREAFATMREHPCADHRNALEIRVTSVQESLAGHLAHEEGQALPMLQRTLSVEDNAAFEKAVATSYGLRIVPFLICWAADGLPEEAVRRVLEGAPPGYRLLERALRRRYLRRERVAFRYV